MASLLFIFPNASIAASLILRLIEFTIKHNRITGEEFVNICKKNKLKLSLKEMSEKLIYSYDEKVSGFLDN